MIDLWDVYQHVQISELQASQHVNNLDSRKNGETLHKEVQRLDSKIDGLALICQALLEILQEKAELSEKEIVEKIKEIDLRDGREDGKLTGKMSSCSKCKRPAHSRQRTCMYCGTAIIAGNIVEKSLTPKPNVRIK